MSLTPKTAMRLLCQDCLGMVQFNRKMVADCQGDTAQRGGCPLYPFRLGRVSVKALRKHCLWCAGGSKEYVRECLTETCPLYIYRYGRNPACANRRFSSHKGAVRGFGKQGGILR